MSKYIIEFDDDIAKGIRGENKCKVEPREIVRSYQATIADAIANGIPYNPTGDLISREALKEAIENITLDKHTMIWITGLREALKYIDTAPPVPQVTVFAENADEKAVADLKAELQNVIEARPNEQIAWEQGYEAGLAQGKHDRPKGEWVDGYGGEYRRTNCSSHSERITPYCWCCGADMRKGDAE